MPTPRKGETREECRVRENARKKQHRKWQTISRRLNKDGEVIGSLQRPVSELLPAKMQRQLQTVRAGVDAMIAELPRIAPVPMPAIQLDDMLVAYPMGDPHMGMLSWKPETGASWDLEIGERTLTGALDYLVRTSPPAKYALLVDVGDFFHYDSTKNVTPTSGHLVDADSRHSNMIRAGIRVMRRVIDALLRRHTFVHVIIEIGNHDLAAAPWLALVLDAVYEQEMRVTVDTSPKHFHYYHFGSCLMGVTHGHGPRAEQLPGIMAVDQREAWGCSRHTYWYTGHYHQSVTRDIQGTIIDCLGILAPNEAYSANRGYRSKRLMESIVYHRNYGELHRHVVTPQMLEDL